MDCEELSLTWDDHYSTLLGVFEKLLESNTLVDCTIAAEGQYLKAHKVVLSACSPYFELLFTQESERNPILVLKDVKFQDLKSMIDFVYRGKVRIAEDRLEDFVAAAESLQIKGLGSGQKTNASNGKKIESSSSLKRRDCASSVPNKRIRKRVSINDENTNSLSSVNDMHDESSSCESFLQNENTVDVAISPASVVSVSQTKASSDVFVQGVSVQKKTNCDRAKPSTSYEPQVQSSSLLIETQPTLASCETVIKSEPEPIAEVFLPETECFMEPKTEICVQEYQLFDSEHGSGTVMADNMCQQSEQNTSQFSDSSASLESADMKSSELVQMAGPSSSKGAALVTATSTHSPFDQHLQPPTTSVLATLLTASGVASALPVAETEAIGRPGSHMCTTCGKAFPSPCKLARHSRVHTGERPFLCRECGKSFTQKESLLLHLRIHTGERPFMCNECGSSFTQKGSLMEHLRLHSEDRPYACEECGMAYKQKTALHKHRLVHTGERPFTCSECGKSFALKGSLEEHRRVHTGERPYACQECGMAFKQKSGLHWHRRVHRGDPPYQCTHCNFTSVTKSLLLSHTRTVHNVQDASGDAFQSP